MGASDGTTARSWSSTAARSISAWCRSPRGHDPGRGEVEFLCESEHLFLRDEKGVASVQLKTPGGSDAIASLVSLYMGQDLPGYTWIKVDAAALGTHVDLCQIVDSESKIRPARSWSGTGARPDRQERVPMKGPWT